MIIYLAGGESWNKQFSECNVQNRLYTYYYMRKSRNSRELIDRLYAEKEYWAKEYKKPLRLFLDSGAFTYRMNRTESQPNPPVYFREYKKFVESTKDLWTACAELDIEGTDAGDTSFAQVEDWREELADVAPGLVVPVYHPVRGRDWWDKMCANPKYPYLGFGSGMGLGDKTRLIATALQYGKKVHGFAETKIQTEMKYLKCHSVDSTTWVRATKYGGLFVFHANQLRILDHKHKEQRRLFKQYFKVNGIDMQKILDEDQSELTKCSLIAWRNMAARFESMGAKREQRREQTATGRSDDRPGTTQNGEASSSRRQAGTVEQAAEETTIARDGRQPSNRVAEQRHGSGDGQMASRRTPRSERGQVEDATRRPPKTERSSVAEQVHEDAQPDSLGRPERLEVAAPKLVRVKLQDLAKRCQDVDKQTPVGRPTESVIPANRPDQARTRAPANDAQTAGAQPVSMARSVPMGSEEIAAEKLFRDASKTLRAAGFSAEQVATILARKKEENGGVDDTGHGNTKPVANAVHHIIADRPKAAKVGDIVYLSGGGMGKVIPFSEMEAATIVANTDLARAAIAQSAANQKSRDGVEKEEIADDTKRADRIASLPRMDSTSSSPSHSSAPVQKISAGEVSKSVGIDDLGANSLVQENKGLESALLVGELEASPNRQNAPIAESLGVTSHTSRDVSLGGRPKVTPDSSSPQTLEAGGTVKLSVQENSGKTHLPVLHERFHPEEIETGLSALKDLPQLACDNCAMSGSCPEEVAGSLCYYTERLHSLPIRDFRAHKAILENLLEWDHERTMRALLLERHQAGGQLDPRVSGQLDGFMSRLREYKDLTNASRGGTVKASIEVSGQQGPGILSKLFGAAMPIGEGTGEIENESSRLDVVAEQK